MFHSGKLSALVWPPDQGTPGFSLKATGADERGWREMGNFQIFKSMSEEEKCSCSMLRTGTRGTDCKNNMQRRLTETHSIEFFKKRRRRPPCGICLISGSWFLWCFQGGPFHTTLVMLEWLQKLYQERWCRHGALRLAYLCEVVQPPRDNLDWDIMGWTKLPSEYYGGIGIWTQDSLPQSSILSFIPCRF